MSLAVNQRQLPEAARTFEQLTKAVKAAVVLREETLGLALTRCPRSCAPT